MPDCQKNCASCQNSSPYLPSTEQISNSTGAIQLTSYPVFPGISLIFHDAHLQSYTQPAPFSGNLLEIHHCREGRMECHFREEFYYISAGDLLVTRVQDLSRTTYFPLRHYHGISVVIDLDRAPKCLSCLLEDVTVQPELLAKKFCGEQNCFVARETPAFSHIFAEIYEVPEDIRKGYFKVKILELLLFLSTFQKNPEEIQRIPFSDAQVTLAKNVAQFLTDHMEQRITLEQLTRQFHRSGTQIKDSFKGVYGVPIYSFIRTQKMESAAYALEHTDKPISEIAGEHGYDNSSKFSEAFRSVKGISPKEYRLAQKQAKLQVN